MSKKNLYYYAADGNRLVRFASFDRLSIFLENMPSYHIAYGYEAMRCPQYELVSDDEWFADELVVDRMGYDVGFFQITYWGSGRDSTAGASPISSSGRYARLTGKKIFTVSNWVNSFTFWLT